MEIKGNTALITGGASGLGAATTRALHGSGANVLIVDLNDELGEALVSELGERAAYAHANVVNPEEMSAAVADRLSLRDRGLLREGMYADVVVFDPTTIADRATFEQPHQLSVGVRYVFVNGTAVVREGKHTGAKPGRIVRGPGYRENRP